MAIREIGTIHMKQMIWAIWMIWNRKITGLTRNFTAQSTATPIFIRHKSFRRLAPPWRELRPRAYDFYTGLVIFATDNDCSADSDKRRFAELSWDLKRLYYGRYIVPTKEGTS